MSTHEKVYVLGWHILGSCSSMACTALVTALQMTIIACLALRGLNRQPETCKSIGQVPRVCIGPLRCLLGSAFCIAGVYQYSQPKILHERMHAKMSCVVGTWCHSESISRYLYSSLALARCSINGHLLVKMIEALSSCITTDECMDCTPRMRPLLGADVSRVVEMYQC